MALTDSLPTGDAGGLTVLDERLVLSGLIAKNADGTPRVGVFPAGSDPLVTGRANMAYDVAPFRAATSRTGAGVELIANDAVTVVATTAAPGANSRIDVIWVRPQFTANADPGNVPIFNVTQGTAAGVPTKPPIPAGALELATAQITSTATSTASVVITQSAPWTATAGGIVPVRNATELTAFPAADGTLAVNLATGGIFRRTGGAWVTSGEDTGWQAVTFLNSWQSAAATETVEIRKLNGVVYIKGRAASGTGTTMFTLPTGFRPKHLIRAMVKNQLAPASPALVDINPTGAVVTPTGTQPVLANISPFPGDA